MRRRGLVYNIIVSLSIGIIIVWILVFYVGFNEEQMVERFEREIEARTYDENVDEVKGLVTHMEDLLDEGLIGKVRDKSLEVEVILNAIDDEKADPEYEDQLIERLKKEIEGRTFEKNISVVMELRAQLLESLNQGDVARSKELASEMKLILDAIEQLEN